jgi:fatty acid desaturase
MIDDLLTAAAVALMTLKWNFLVHSELVSEKLVEEMQADVFIAATTVFALFLVATGFHRARAAACAIIFALLAYVDSIAAVRFACVAFIFLTLFLSRSSLRQLPITMFSGGGGAE